MEQFQAALSICTWSPENRELEKKKIFEEILTEIFPNLFRTSYTQINNPKLEKHEEKPQAHHNCSKSKINRKSLKVDRGKKYRGRKINVTVDFC